MLKKFADTAYITFWDPLMSLVKSWQVSSVRLLEFLDYWIHQILQHLPSFFYLNKPHLNFVFKAAYVI